MGPRTHIGTDARGLSAMSRRTGDALRVGALALGIAFGSTVLGLIGIAVGAQQSFGVAVVLRGLGAVVVLVIGLALAASIWRTVSAGSLLIGALLSYLLMPLALAGRALFTQLFTPSSVIAIVGDLLQWLLIASLVLTIQVRRYPRDDPASSQMQGW